MHPVIRDFWKYVHRVTGEVLVKQYPIKIDPSAWHPEAERARATLTETLSGLFASVQSVLVDEAKKLLKSITEEEVRDALDAALADLIDDELIANLQADLEAAIAAGIAQARAQIHVNDANMISELNSIARDWASQRAAEMVGMKLVDGKLVENPNAEWAITSAVRQQIRSIVTDAFESETPLDSMIADIQDAGAFSDSRAEMIARTEVSNAQSQGNYEVWTAVGVEQVQWLLSADHSEPCVCEDNEDELRAIGKPFPSGDLMPPAHPNCWCVLVAVPGPD